ncbi:MAG: RDD family protein [Candidatus Riflebacteria bacterium]|nr:RDD family protein [Candidatus Riflebacteria bacterium]
MPEDVRLTTPENIEIRFPLAGFCTRGKAFFYDCLYQFLLSIGVVYIGVEWLAHTPLSFLAAPLSIALTFLVVWGYHILFEIFLDGQTPGKRHFGIRVVTLDGQRIEFFPSMVRNLARIVDFLPFGFVAGAVAMLSSRHHQRIGDLFSRTMVIRDRAPLGADPPAAPKAAGLPDVFGKRFTIHGRQRV